MWSPTCHGVNMFEVHVHIRTLTSWPFDSFCFVFHDPPCRLSPTLAGPGTIRLPAHAMKFRNRQNRGKLDSLRESAKHLVHNVVCVPDGQETHFDLLEHPRVDQEMGNSQHVFVFVFSPTVVHMKIQGWRQGAFNLGKCLQQDGDDGVAPGWETVVPSVAAKRVFGVARHVDAGDVCDQFVLAVEVLWWAWHARQSSFGIVHVVHFDDHVLVLRVGIDRLLHVLRQFFSFTHLPLVVFVMLGPPVELALSDGLCDQLFQSHAVGALGETFRSTYFDPGQGTRFCEVCKFFFGDHTILPQIGHRPSPHRSPSEIRQVDLVAVRHVVTRFGSIRMKPLLAQQSDRTWLPGPFVSMVEVDVTIPPRFPSPREGRSSNSMYGPETGRAKVSIIAISSDKLPAFLHGTLSLLAQLRVDVQFCVYACIETAQAPVSFTNNLGGLRNESEVVDLRRVSSEYKNMWIQEAADKWFDSTSGTHQKKKNKKEDKGKCIFHSTSGISQTL